MSRSYTMTRRADQQAETRQKIVEAAVELHSSVGPARTTFSMVAERAGVQRHTLYAHFPDERSLFMACSGLVLERSPMPDAEPWREISDIDARLSAGLGAIYAWFEENAELTGCLMRDVEHHAVLQEIQAMRAVPVVTAWVEVLGEGLTPGGRAMLALALSFYTWRTLVREAGQSSQVAALMMAAAVRGAS